MNNDKFNQLIGQIIGGCLTLLIVAFTVWVIFWMFGGF